MHQEGCISILSNPLITAYALSKRGFYRQLIRSIALRLEKGGWYSYTIREIFKRFHDVEIGYYSNGACYSAQHYPRGTRIGRYCSIMESMSIFSGNHPSNTKSTHGLFFNPSLGFAKKDLITRTSITIEDDVWVGHNACIVKGVRTIGRGAIIGAGAVIHQDVPPYAIAVGNPARIVRYRFSEDIIARLQEERWWEKSISELSKDLSSFQHPLEGSSIQ